MSDLKPVGLWRAVDPAGKALHGTYNIRATLVESIERSYPGLAYTVEQLWEYHEDEWRVEETPEQRAQALVYAFGHLVASYTPDAHAGDSGDLGQEVLDRLGLDEKAKAAVHRLAEHVAESYTYMGEQ